MELNSPSFQVNGNLGICFFPIYIHISSSDENSLRLLFYWLVTEWNYWPTINEKLNMPTLLQNMPMLLHSVSGIHLANR